MLATWTQLPFVHKMKGRKEDLKDNGVKQIKEEKRRETKKENKKTGRRGVADELRLTAEFKIYRSSNMCFTFHYIWSFFFFFLQSVFSGWRKKHAQKCTKVATHCSRNFCPISAAVGLYRQFTVNLHSIPNFNTIPLAVLVFYAWLWTELFRRAVQRYSTP